MKKILMLIMGLMAAMVWASTDLKTYLDSHSIEGTAEFNAWTAGETYTLNEDYAITNTAGEVARMRWGRDCTYQFADGVRFKLKEVRFYGDKTPATFTLKGGIWDFNNTGSFNCAGWGNLPYSGYTWELDNVIITNQSTWVVHGGIGHDRTLRVKNSTVYIGSNYVDLMPTVADASVVSGGGVSSLVEFGPAAKLIGTQIVFDNRNTAASAMQNGILRFKGEGTMYAGAADGSRSVSHLSIGSNKVAPGYRLEVLDGALVNVRTFDFGESSWSNSVLIANATMTNEYSVEVGKLATGRDNDLVIAGTNAQYVSMSSFDLGMLGSGNSLTVTNGACMKVLDNFRIGNGSSTSNRVWVAGNSQLTVGTDLALGLDNTQGDNELRIEDSSVTVTDTSKLDIHGYGNALVLSNATATVKGVEFAKYAAQGKLTIAGVGTSLSFLKSGTYAEGGTVWNPFSAATDACELEITDGVELQCARLQWSDDCTNATLRITNNAKITVDEYFWMGLNSAAKNATCEISNGGILTSARGGSIRVAGNSDSTTANTYIVDDGTIRFSGSQGIFFKGDGVMRLRGASPKVVAYNDDSAQCQFRDQSQVYFELPTNGAAYAEAPLQGCSVTWHSTAALHIVNAAECFEALNCSTNIPLVRMTTPYQVSSYIPQTVVDAANAELPEYAQVVYATDGKGLDLKFKKTIGLIFMLSGTKPVPVTLTFDDGCPGQLQVAEPMISARGWKGTFNICTGWTGPNVMTWDQIRELHNRGHEIASHSSKHPRLSELIASNDVERLDQEIGGSRDKIYAEIGVYPTWFCTPYIEYSDEINTLVEEAGMHVMTIPRIPFGDGYPADKDYTKKLKEELAKNPKALDILIHGITKEYGGWNPFDDAAEFGRFLDAIKTLEDQGLIKVVTYDVAYAAYNA